VSEWEGLIPRPTSAFLKVRCRSCGSEQIVFSHTTHVIKCRNCEEILAETRGGKAKINGIVIAVLG